MYLYGASGHAKVIIDILEELSIYVEAIYDDDISKKDLLNHGVVHSIPRKRSKWIIAIGNNQIRRKIVESNDFAYGLAIHPGCSIGSAVDIGHGTVAMAGVCINSSSQIGRHVIINTMASIDHDCIINDFAHIAPNATLCGGVAIGNTSLIGAGAVIIPNISIGNNVIVGAGSLITTDIEDNCTVMGSPARIIKKNA